MFFGCHKLTNDGKQTWASCNKSANVNVMDE